MSFYIELKNWDSSGPKTFLVQSFNAASKVVEAGKGLFKEDKYGPDPEVTRVVLESQGFRNGGMWVEIPVPYEDFKKTLVASKTSNEIPSFTATQRYIAG